MGDNVYLYYINFISAAGKRKLKLLNTLLLVWHAPLFLSSFLSSEGGLLNKIFFFTIFFSNEL